MDLVIYADNVTKIQPIQISVLLIFFSVPQLEEIHPHADVRQVQAAFKVFLRQLLKLCLCLCQGHVFAFFYVIFDDIGFDYCSFVISRAVGVSCVNVKRLAVLGLAHRYDPVDDSVLIDVHCHAHQVLAVGDRLSGGRASFKQKDVVIVTHHAQICQSRYALIRIQNSLKKSFPAIIRGDSLAAVGVDSKAMLLLRAVGTQRRDRGPDRHILQVAVNNYIC